MKKYPGYVNVLAKCNGNFQYGGIFIFLIQNVVRQCNMHHVSSNFSMDKEVVDYDQYLIELIPPISIYLFQQTIKITLHRKCNKK